MFRLLGALALTSALVLPASAAVDWTKYGNFTKTRCEDAKTRVDLVESAKGLRYDDGGASVTSSLSDLRLISVATLSATATKLVCKVSVEYSSQNGTGRLRGRYTIQIGPGKWATHFVPQ